MKELINKYIEYLKEKAHIKYYRCEHDWEKINQAIGCSKLNTKYEWLEFTYRCKKCCESKIISTLNKN